MKGVYINTVQKHKQREIEKRSTRSNLATSLIGYGPVSATVTKETSKGILRNYMMALEQIRSLKKQSTVAVIVVKQNEENKENKQTYDPIFSVFFLEKKPTIKRKRKQKTIEKKKKTKKKKKNTVKNFNFQKTFDDYIKDGCNPSQTIKPQDTPPLIVQYYDRCKKNIEFGSIGQIPAQYKDKEKKEYVMPATIENFLKTSSGEILLSFCKIMKIK